MTSTSTAPAISRRVHSHAVPAARLASPEASASATCWLASVWTMRSSGQPSPSLAFWIPRRSTGPLSSAASQIAPSRLEITLWLLAVTPTRFRPASRSRIMRAPV